MEMRNKRTAGIYLITGSVLLTLTMILHPTGGSIEHILQIKHVAITSHALAIMSLPFLVLGFFGLSKVFLNGDVTRLAFVVVCFGLVAAMLAAMINGITLPIFLSRISGSDYDPQVVKAIVSYGFSLNVSLDYILIFSITLSVFIWSLLMIFNNAISKWLGYYGVALCILGALGLIFKFDFISVFGFRIFIFSLVSWLIITGFLMYGKHKSENATQGSYPH